MYIFWNYIHVFVYDLIHLYLKSFVFTYSPIMAKYDLQILFCRTAGDWLHDIESHVMKYARVIDRV